MFEVKPLAWIMVGLVVGSFLTNTNTKRQAVEAENAATSADISATSVTQQDQHPLVLRTYTESHSIALNPEGND